jgi:serine/threonine protein kinase
MGVFPFTAQNEGALLRKIMGGKYATIVGYSASLIDIVTKCLTFNYKNRPNTQTLLRFPTLVAKVSFSAVLLITASTGQ